MRPQHSARPSPRPRPTHPLMGADLLTLTRQLAHHWPLPRSTWPFIAAALGSALARTPFSLAEGAWTGIRRRRAPAPPPVFIVGHWRSGTTHLYNLMSRDPQFGFVTPVATGLPWDFYLLGRALRPLLERALPAHRFIDRVRVTPDAPQEDEIALASMQTLSFYHGLYFPERLESWFDQGVFFDDATPRQIARWRRCLRAFVDKLALLQPGRRPLIKNPVYTARVAELARMWPEARFIHIHRDPYVVFQSTRNFYRKLLHELALQPYDDDGIDELILSRYPRMMRILIDDFAGQPAGHTVETSFERLERDPMATLAAIYATLGLDGFDDARPHFEAYLAELGDYRKNRYDSAAADIERVTRRWRPYLAHWGYTPRTADPSEEAQA